MIAREFDVIIAWRGQQAICLSDNGTEVTGVLVLRFSHERQLSRGASRRKTPSSSVSPRLRGASYVLAQARSVLAARKTTTTIPGQQSALGNLTPTEYANRSVPEPQRGGTLRFVEGSARDPAASPSPMGSYSTGPIGG